MPKFAISMPIVGDVTCVVEAEDHDSAFDAFDELWESDALEFTVKPGTRAVLSVTYVHRIVVDQPLGVVTLDSEISVSVAACIEIAEPALDDR